MKRIFLLLCIVSGLYGLSWAVGSGQSVEGDSASVTITLNNPRDSVWLRFASPDDNFYDSVKAVPIAGTSNKILIAPYLNLDSIGGHLIVAFTFTGDAVAETVVGQWLHENPNLTAQVIWTENLSGYVSANWAGTFLHGLSDNQDWNQWDNPKSDTASGMGDWFADWFNANHWLTSDGDTNTNPFDASSDKVTLVDSSAEDVSYVKNHPDDFKATIPDSTRLYFVDKQIISHVVYETLYVHRTDFQGAGGDSTNIYYADKRVIAHVVYETLYVHKGDFHSSGDTIGREASTFDPASDNVAVVDSVTGVGRVDSVRKVYILDSLDQTITAEADTEAIARYNWNYATRTLTSGTGSGSNQVTIRTKSLTDSSVIPKATVAVWNADQSSLMGLLSSDTDSGKAVFALDNGTYNLRMQKYKFQWTVPITIGVSGNKDTTVYATEFTPSPPPAPYFVTVYGYLDSVGLIGQRAKISCTIYAQELRYGSVLLGYYSYTKTAYTNASGYWEMFLYANADLTPAGTQYEFVIKTPDQPILKKWVTVPKQTSWEFTF